MSSITIDSAYIDCRPECGIADIQRYTEAVDDSIPHIDAALKRMSNLCGRNCVDPSASEPLVGLVGFGVDCLRRVAVRHAGRQGLREQVSGLHSTGDIHSSSIAHHRDSRIGLRIGNCATLVVISMYHKTTTDVIWLQP